MSIKNVDAVIVLYFPDVLELAKLLEIISSQVNNIHLIDNTDGLSTNEIEQYLSNCEYNFNYIKLGGNKGIGAAHNVGIKAASNHGADSVLILDQDSVPPSNLVEVLTQCFNNASISSDIACVGPVIVDKQTRKEYKSVNRYTGEKEHRYVKSIISSGSLIVMDVYKKIGDMDEDLFIDNVDFDWCWRAIYQGYKVVQCRNVEMKHKVGEHTISIFNLFELQVPGVIRHYYQVRNRMLLIGKNYVPKYFKVRSIVMTFIELFVYSFFVSPRLKRSKMMIKGLIDGIFGKKGKLVLNEKGQ